MSALLALALVFPLAEELDLPLGPEAEQSASITVPELKAHVYRLASPAFQGRRGAGAARAAQHLARAFERLGLQPAFGDSYFQPIPWLLANPEDRDRSFVGRNVGAVLPGTDPNLKDEWVVVSAHFDHLGVKNGKLYPGADDNASGVAMLLEVAERLKLQPEKPRCTILFVAFDKEEEALQGSTHFATKPPLPIRKLRAFLTADMLGRSMANVMDEFVFVLGSESSSRLRELIEKVQPPEGLRVGRLGADIIGTRSDYGPFRDRQVPFLFFSTGQHPDYHRTTDLPERIDYEKLRRVSDWIHDLTWQLANDDRGPTWQVASAGKPDLEEARTVLTLLSRVLARPALYPLREKQREVVEGVRQRLMSIVERGRISLDERSWLLWSSRLLLATIF